MDYGVQFSLLYFFPFKKKICLPESVSLNDNQEEHGGCVLANSYWKQLFSKFKEDYGKLITS